MEEHIVAKDGRTRTADDAEGSAKSLAPTKVAQARAPRFQKGKDRVAVLKAAGALVIAEKGYDATTMKEIAVRAGSSIGSLYQFFPTKQALASVLHMDCLEILANMFRELFDLARDLEQGELVDELFDHLSRFLSRHPEFPELAERRDVSKTLKASTRRRLRSQLKDLLLSGRATLDPSRSIVVGIVAMELIKSTVALARTDGKKIRAGVEIEYKKMLKAFLRHAN